MKNCPRALVTAVPWQGICRYTIQSGRALTVDTPGPSQLRQAFWAILQQSGAALGLISDGELLLARKPPMQAPPRGLLEVSYPGEGPVRGQLA